jgi:hypothetical protein
MSVSTCVRCDGPECKEQVHRDPMMYPGEWHLSDTWFTLVRGDTQLHTARHFCSLACLHGWTEGQCPSQGGE